MPTFEENKHPRDSDGKFTDKDGKFRSKGNKGSKEYRQNTDYKQILEDKYNSEFQGKPKKKNYVELSKIEYAQMCSAIRTRYTNNIPKNGGIFLRNSYHRFRYNKATEQIFCTKKILIVGNEDIIKELEQNKNVKY